MLEFSFAFDIVTLEQLNTDYEYGECPNLIKVANIKFFFFIIPSSASNRIIGAKDHASIQLNIAEVWHEFDHSKTGLCRHAFMNAIW